MAELPEQPHELSPLRELLSLAGPTVLQMASYTVMQFIDTWLVSRLGYVEAAAVAMSGLLTFSIFCFGIGTLQLVNTLVSQSFGKGDYPSCGQFLWQGVWVGAAYALLLAPVAPLANGIFKAMGHEPRMAGFEAHYMRIVVAFAFVEMVSASFGRFLLAVNSARAVLVAAVCGVSANVVVAYAMILGNWGMPKLGIAGAAWAQNIGVIVEASTLVMLSLRPSIRAKFNSLDWRPRWRQIKTLWSVGWPSGVQFVADVLAWSMFSALVMGQLGDEAMAANMFTFKFMSVSFMPALGIGAAVTALVGRYIGMGKPEIAIKRANLAFMINMAYMLACGAAFYIWRHDLMRLFTDDGRVLKIGAMMLIFAAVYQIADAIYCTYNGALRGAGDTFVPAVATIFLNWGLTVGVAFCVARYWRTLGAAGPWWVATGYGMILGAFIYIRFVRGSWRHIRLVDQAASEDVNVQRESNRLRVAEEPG